MGNLPLRYNGLRNLRGVSCVQHEPRKGLKKKLAVVTLEEKPRKQVTVSPCRACVELFAQHLAATFALSVRLVERFSSSSLGSKLIFESFDQLQVKLRVEFLEYRHRQRVAEWPQLHC